MAAKYWAGSFSDGVSGVSGSSPIGAAAGGRGTEVTGLRAGGAAFASPAAALPPNSDTTTTHKTPQPPRRDASLMSAPFLSMLPRTLSLALHLVMP